MLGSMAFLFETGSYYVALASLKLQVDQELQAHRDLLASVSQVLRLRVDTPMPGLNAFCCLTLPLSFCFVLYGFKVELCYV